METEARISAHTVVEVNGLGPFFFLPFEDNLQVIKGLTEGGNTNNSNGVVCTFSSQVKSSNRRVKFNVLKLKFSIINLALHVFRSNCLNFTCMHVGLKREGREINQKEARPVLSMVCIQSLKQQIP